MIHPLGSQNSHSTPNLAAGKGRSSLDRPDEIHLSDPKEAAYNPDAYKRYKRRLRAATLESYKGLEVLKNYRVLNLTGFRKALKKFEKAAKVRQDVHVALDVDSRADLLLILQLHIMSAYTADRINNMTFSSPHTVDDLLEEVETLYAARFGECSLHSLILAWSLTHSLFSSDLVENGDQKKARDRLRVTASTKTHHRSTFMTGIYIGLAMPVLVHSIVLSTYSPHQSP